jgi:hypothetical protein
MISVARGVDMMWGITKKTKRVIQIARLLVLVVDVLVLEALIVSTYTLF